MSLCLHLSVRSRACYQLVRSYPSSAPSSTPTSHKMRSTSHLHTTPAHPMAYHQEWQTHCWRSLMCQAYKTSSRGELLKQTHCMTLEIPGCMLMLELPACFTRTDHSAAVSAQLVHVWCMCGVTCVSVACQVVQIRVCFQHAHLLYLKLCITLTIVEGRYAACSQYLSRQTTDCFCCRYNQSGVTALRFDADYSGLLDFDRAECIIETEVLEDKIVEVPIGELHRTSLCCSVTTG